MGKRTDMQEIGTFVSIDVLTLSEKHIFVESLGQSLAKNTMSAQENKDIFYFLNRLSNGDRLGGMK